MDSGRRNILRWGALALGSVAGAVGIGAIAEKTLGAAGANVTRSDGSTVITLHGSSWHLQAPGLMKGVPPRTGDRVTLSGILHAAPGGTQVGTFFATSMHLSTPGAATYAEADMQMHTIHLQDGTVMGMGTTQGGQTEFAVVGGTGRYAGATGTYSAIQDPVEVGGNGTAEITLTLKLREETR